MKLPYKGAFMEPIATYKRTKEIIKNNSFYIKKNFGQNFLIDQHVINKIIAGSEIGPEDFVIEVGPGLGGLTERLSLAAKSVTAVEIDSALIPVLEENLAHCPNVKIINGDILKTDLNLLILESGFNYAKIAANLPYYITTPIIMGVLENCPKVKSLIVMVQKEVGERIRAKAGTKDYGALTLAVQYRARVSVIANVPRNSFLPRPNVDSVVLKLDVLGEPAVKAKSPELMFKIIRCSFEQRRKTIVNCIYNVLDTGLDKDTLAHACEKANLSPLIRGEELALSDFQALSDCLYELLEEQK